MQPWNQSPSLHLNRSRHLFENAITSHVDAPIPKSMSMFWRGARSPYSSCFHHVYNVVVWGKVCWGGIQPQEKLLLGTTATQTHPPTMAIDCVGRGIAPPQPDKGIHRPGISCSVQSSIVQIKWMRGQWTNWSDYEVFTLREWSFLCWACDFWGEACTLVMGKSQQKGGGESSLLSYYDLYMDSCEGKIYLLMKEEVASMHSMMGLLSALMEKPCFVSF